MNYHHSSDLFDDVGELTVCFYCGQPAQALDHVIPRSVLRMTSGNDFESPIKPRYETVDACSECNNWLGDKIYDTVGARKAAAKDHIRKKYKKYLNMPDWSDDELNEFGYTLRSHIKRSMAIKKLSRMRLDW